MRRKKSRTRIRNSKFKGVFGFIILISIFIIILFTLTNKNYRKFSTETINYGKQAVNRINDNKRINKHSQKTEKKEYREKSSESNESVLTVNNNKPTETEVSETNYSDRKQIINQQETESEKNSTPATETIEKKQFKSVSTPILSNEPLTDLSKPENKPSDYNKSGSETTNIEVSRGDISSKKIALTFDAGASAKPTIQILNILAKHNIRCTFFLTGKWMEKNPSLTRKITEAGHEIGNHSYSHRDFTKLNNSEIAAELDKTDRMVTDLTGFGTKPLLRLPYGARDKRVLNTIRDQGYRSIYWDIDSWDSVKKDITPEYIRDRINAKVRNGSIILFHCGSQQTADCLDSLINDLKKSGFDPISVSRLINL